MNQAMILQKLRLLGSSLISDAKGGTDVVNYEIRSRTNEEHLIAGIAETVQILQKSLDPVRSIFDKCAKKSSIILAIDASGLFGAVWGEIFTRFAKKSNIIGEWATTFTPGFELGTHVSVPIMVGGVLIRPGDYIVADIDGVVVLRPEEITNVLEKAENIKTME